MTATVSELPGRNGASAQPSPLRPGSSETVDPAAIADAGHSIHELPLQHVAVLDAADLEALSQGRVPTWLQAAAGVDLANYVRAGVAARVPSHPLYAPVQSRVAGGVGGARGVPPDGSTVVAVVGEESGAASPMENGAQRDDEQPAVCPGGARPAKPGGTQ